MPAPIDIANDALDQINEAPIAALDGTDARSQKAKRGYDIRLPAVLESAPWGFANRRIEIAKETAAPIADWLYQYVVPEGYVRARRVNGGVGDEIAWAEEDGKILTNETSPIILEFTFLEIDLNKWSPTARLVFSTLLASHYAKSFKADDKRAASLFEQYLAIVAQAQTIDSQKRSPTVPSLATLTTETRRY